jgi:hypothetical protein
MQKKLTLSDRSVYVHFLADRGLASLFAVSPAPADNVSERR